MKSLFKNILLLSILILFTDVLKAQTPATGEPTTKQAEMLFPPLEILIDSALKQNAMVRYRNLDIDNKELNLKMQRNYWLRNLGVQGDTRYGTIDAFSTNTNGVTNSLSNITTRQLNYAVGVYIKLPVFDVVNRKTQINQAKTELLQAKSMAEAQENEIRQAVIRLYQDLLLKQKLLSIKAQNLGSATVNMDMVEKEFRNGLIPITEYVRIADMTARIQADYEIAQSDFISTKKILEEIAGFTFNSSNSKNR